MREKTFSRYRIGGGGHFSEFMEYVNKSIKYLLLDKKLYIFSIIGLCLFKNPKYNYIGYVLILNILKKILKNLGIFLLVGSINRLVIELILVNEVVTNLEEPKVKVPSHN